MQKGETCSMYVCVGGKSSRLFCIEEACIESSDGRKSKNPSSEGAAELYSPVKVAPSFVLSSQRISTLSFLLLFVVF